MMNSNSISLYDILFESLPKGFSFEELQEKSHRHPEYAASYAAKFFKLDKTFDSGSSRSVFILDSKRVLKVARNEAGFAQNKEEFKNFRRYPLIGAKIYKSGPKNEYLISELVREVRNYEELINYFGFDIFSALSMSSQDKIKQIRNNEQASELLDSIRNGLAEGDILRLDHWGKTVNGRYVLLDYGASDEIINTYY